MMKSSFILNGMCFVLLILFFSACSSNDKEDPAGGQSIGVHKIVIELSGDNEVTFQGSFIGTSTTSSARLYDSTGEYQGELYAVGGKVSDLSTIGCYTENNGTMLNVGFILTCIEEQKKASYSVKAYIDNKLVDELQKEITFGSGKQTETISLTTNKY